MDIVERRLLACLTSYELGGASILVAFSGGSDSTALLRASAAISSEIGFTLYSAWVDHGIRPQEERSEERRFVESLTSRLGVPCDITEPPFPPLLESARRSGAGVEAEAREFRYRALVRAARRFGCSRILTAHTKDDQTETILFRVLSGSGAAGLRGIPESRPPFLRPFLSLTKRELIRYLESLGQDWRDDSTNAHGDYRRNRIRREVLPLLDDIIPGFRSALFALSEKSRLDEEFLSKLARESLPVMRSEKETAVPVSAFWKAHPALRLRMLTSEAGRFAGKARVPYALVRIAALAEPPFSGGGLSGGARTLAEGAGVKFLVDGDCVRIILRGTDVTNEGGFSFLFEEPGIRRIDTGGVCRIYFSREANGPVSGTFHFPILVRSRRPGDRIDIRGGAKALDELAAELGIRRELRASVPILEDREGVFAVLGTAVGGRNRYRYCPTEPDLSSLRLCVEFKMIGPFS